MSSSEAAVRLETAATSANEWDTQLASSEIPAIVGHAYEFSFYIRSEGAGQGRISFQNMSDNYPWLDGASLFNVGGGWTQIVYGSDGSLTATDNNIRFLFDLGKVPYIIYYIDVNTIRVVDLDAVPEETDGNILTDGNFESGTDGWTKPNPGQGIDLTQEFVYEGNNAVKLIAGSSSSNACWDLQFQSPEIAVINGHTYDISFIIRSEGDGRGRVSFTGMSNNYPWLNGSEWFTTNTTWAQITYTLTVNADVITLSFDLGYEPDMIYYLDGVKVIDTTTGAATRVTITRAGPTYIEKTSEEKTKLIGDALEYWINEMVGHYKDKVKAWDVVNEPMNEGGGLRTGVNVTTPASDEFYWQDYLGKDYAVTAFKLVRAAGNANDVLFINDYNLEYSINKCKGLIEYVKYIEEQGAKVDGIGTQMHVDIDTDMAKADEMFKLLAATGKLIKISELDIKTKTSSPSTEDLEKQAEVYRQVVELYVKNIPEAQRYGITLWGVTDADSWIENDAPCLWKADYSRKIAYKGLADGLAGKDVSEDFTGDLEY
ncbi:Endo-1 4-beta-xylanase A [termite gut metagenome]|uniref:endo-1,4-beta-xylanase n=1 Tax=termite gut metagenome TaxID=433724 RepID=A0A5J4S389_9ZZZZ